MSDLLKGIVGGFGAVIVWLLYAVTADNPGDLRNVLWLGALGLTLVTAVFLVRGVRDRRITPKQSEEV